MLGEKDVSILGRLRDAVGYTFIEYKNYVSGKLEEIKGKIEPAKDRILGHSTNQVKNIER